MSETNNQLVIVITHGPEDERSSVGFTIANGGITPGLNVAVFLTSSAVDAVRKGATDLTHVQPLEPLRALIDDFQTRGGELWACTPCAKARGYQQDDLIEGVVITGASLMHERILAGARTLSF